MPDLDELPFRLDHELPDVRWDDAAALRGLGTRRRRSRIVVLAAAAAVVAVAAGSWAMTARPEAGPPPVGPAPTSALIPDAALLQPEDVQAGYEIQNPFVQQPGENPAWAFGAGDCPRYDALHIDAFLGYSAFRGHSLGAPGDLSGDTGVHTEVRRYPDPLASEVLADAERVVGACALWESDGSEHSTDERPATAERSYATVDRGFAGDESLLVRHQIDTFADGEPIDRSTLLIGVVRVGDLVAVTELDRDDVQRVRELTKAAAARLAAA